MHKLINTNYLHTKEKLQYRSAYLHTLQLHLLSPIQAFMISQFHKIGKGNSKLLTNVLYCAIQ